MTSHAPMLARRTVAVAALLWSSILAPAQAQGLSAVRVACEGSSAGAAITINGAYKGDCPLDAEVAPGQIEVVAVQRVDASRERRFSTRFGIGAGVVRRVDVQLGPAQLTPEGQRAEDERRRAQAEAARRTEESRRNFEQRMTAQRELAARDAERRAREREALRIAAFAEAGLVAGTGQPFRDCAECPELVWIPAGRAAPSPQRDPIDSWHARFELRVPLAVGRFEVTFDEWDACVAAGGCPHRPAEGASEGLLFDTRWGRGRQPVVNVSWAHAQQYTQWLSQRTGQRYRLLSQIEFAYATRAGATTLFPWGDRRDMDAANCPGCGPRSRPRTLAVGSFAPNAWGLHDTAGNVSEWVADCYGPNVRGARGWLSPEEVTRVVQQQLPDGRPVNACEGVSNPAHGVMGGDYSAYREPQHSLSWIGRETTSSSVGLRVAREFTPTATATVDPASLRPFRDCDDCPELVRLPAGVFEMGSPVSPDPFVDGWNANETPTRWVRVPSFAIGRFEVTRGQWATFERERAAAGTSPPGATASGAGANGSCTYIDRSGRDQHVTWMAPGFAQDDRHPVVCVTLAAAQAYLEWLSQRTGQRYRLPTEAEWEYAARAGRTEHYPWGEKRQNPPACDHANLHDFRMEDAQGMRRGSSGLQCDDGFAFTAPVGSFRANAWGLHDMLGNASEWVADGWGSYVGAPADGSVPARPASDKGILRGGSWNEVFWDLYAARRLEWPVAFTRTHVGLRVVREIRGQP